jgi:DNA polymerase-1
MPRLLVIDGLNEFIRHYAANPLLSSNGIPVGGIFGFIRSLQRFTDDFDPTRVIICLDGQGGSSRKRGTFKGYKEGRKPLRLNRFVDTQSFDEEQNNKVWQLARLTEYIEDLPVQQFIYDGIEADDLIAYITNHEAFYDWQKIIVSSDKDFIQLLNDKTLLYRPMKKVFESVKTILKEYSIHPNNFCLARSMAGDVSDNIKGVEGVGLKTLAKRFPFLSEEKDYYLDDVQKYCQEQIGNKSKLKVYEQVQTEKDRIKENYSIMQLASPNFSIQTKMKINQTLQDCSFSFNKSKFIGKMIQDQVALDFNLDNLYSWSRRIIIDGNKK